MAEIINLRMALKLRARETGAAQAAANRARHGQTKAAKAAAAQSADRLAAQVDGARRDTPLEHKP